MTDGDGLTPAERIDPAEHIDADDERYDGFRIREYWIATVVAPDNQEAPLGVDPLDAPRFHMTPGPAMAADQRRLHHLREFAKEIASANDIEVVIRHFVSEGEPEIVKP